MSKEEGSPYRDPFQNQISRNTLDFKTEHTPGKYVHYLVIA